MRYHKPENGIKAVIGPICTNEPKRSSTGKTYLLCYQQEMVETPDGLVKVQITVTQKPENRIAKDQEQKDKETVRVMEQEHKTGFDPKEYAEFVAFKKAQKAAGK